MALSMQLIGNTLEKLIRTGRCAALEKLISMRSGLTTEVMPPNLATVIIKERSKMTNSME